MNHKHLITVHKTRTKSCCYHCLKLLNAHEGLSCVQCKTDLSSKCFRNLSCYCGKECFRKDWGKHKELFHDDTCCQYPVSNTGMFWTLLKSGNIIRASKHQQTSISFGLGSLILNEIDKSGHQGLTLHGWVGSDKEKRKSTVICFSYVSYIFVF